MSQAEEYQEVEVTIEQLQKVVDRRDKLNKLFSNREFKALVLDEYMKEEPARLTKLLGDSTQAAHKDNIIADLTAIGKLDEFFRVIFSQGLQAEQALNEHMEYLNELDEEATA